MTAKIKLNAASGGGSFSLQAPSSSSNNRVFTLPDIADATMATVNGITEADIWRVTAQFTTGTGYTTLTSNWERADTGNSGKIGTGMTESSGVFTYPSTGIYLVQFGAWGNAGANGSAHTAGHNIQSTVDNGSNYTYNAGMYYSIPNVSTYSYNGGTCQHMFDVTDVSTHKSRMVVYSSSSVTWEASTNQNNVYVSFIRLGDT